MALSHSNFACVVQLLLLLVPTPLLHSNSARDGKCCRHLVLSSVVYVLKAVTMASSSQQPCSHQAGASRHSLSLTGVTDTDSQHRWK